MTWLLFATIKSSYTHILHVFYINQRLCTSTFYLYVYNLHDVVSFGFCYVSKDWTLSLTARLALGSDAFTVCQCLVFIDMFWQIAENVQKLKSFIFSQSFVSHAWHQNVHSWSIFTVRFIMLSDNKSCYFTAMLCFKYPAFSKQPTM